MGSDKVLFVSSNFPPVIGGSAVVYDQLCRNADGEIVALAPCRDYRTGEQWKGLEEADNSKPYKIYRVPFLRPPAQTGEAPSRRRRVVRAIVRDLPVMIGVLAQILRLIIRHRVKVICLGELIYGGWLVLPLRYVFGRRVFIYTHGEEISQESSNLLARRRGLFLRHANRIIAVSLFCKGQIISKFGIDPSKIIVVNNGVDLGSFNRSEPIPSVWPSEAKGRRIILSVSRLVERKGQDTLIRAMPLVLSKHPDTHCVIVGGGPQEAQLRRLVMTMGLQDHCTIIGPAPQERVVRYFKSCDIFALPCRTMPDGDTEGFGLVFLEAGACGKPVVAGVAGGTIEAVADGVTGFLVDGFSPVQVAYALDKLLSDSDLALRMGEAGWKEAQGCGWQSVAAKFLSACRSDAEVARLPTYDQTFPAFPRTKSGEANEAPKLLVTIDVEEQFGWDRFEPSRYAVSGSSELSKFHSDCRSIGVKPVYLVTYPILQNPDFRELIKRAVSSGEAEAGIHLHSWTVPPHWEEANAFTSYQCNLPEHVEAAKLHALSRKFAETFGFPVKIHRAGRWGGSSRTSRLLEEMGISCDLSPSTGYTDQRAGGPDFTELNGAPFWSGPKRTVLTIPASSVNYFRGPRWFSATAFGAARNWPSLQPKAWRRGKPVRFSPENADLGTLLSISTELKLRGLPTAVYTLHSTSLYAGGNPYSSSATEAASLRSLSLEFLSRAIDSGLLVPSSCAELLEAAKLQRDPANERRAAEAAE